MNYCAIWKGLKMTYDQNETTVPFSELYFTSVINSNVNNRDSPFR